jgi:hypothetical protein
LETKNREINVIVFFAAHCQLQMKEVLCRFIVFKALFVACGWRGVPR